MFLRDWSLQSELKQDLAKSRLLFNQLLKTFVIHNNYVLLVIMTILLIVKRAVRSCTRTCNFII